MTAVEYLPCRMSLNCRCRSLRSAHKCAHSFNVKLWSSSSIDTSGSSSRSSLAL